MGSQYLNSIDFKFYSIEAMSHMLVSLSHFYFSSIITPLFFPCLLFVFPTPLEHSRTMHGLLPSHYLLHLIAAQLVSLPVSCSLRGIIPYPGFSGRVQITNILFQCPYKHTSAPRSCVLIWGAGTWRPSQVRRDPKNGLEDMAFVGCSLDRGGSRQTGTQAPDPSFWFGCSYFNNYPNPSPTVVYY